MTSPDFPSIKEAAIDYTQIAIDVFGPIQDIQDRYNVKNDDLDDYLESLGKLIACLKEKDSFDPSDNINGQLYPYPWFADPNAAYDASKNLGVDNPGDAGNILFRLHSTRNLYDDAPEAINPERVKAFKKSHDYLQAFASKVGLDTKYIETVPLTYNIKDAYDPLEYTENLKAALAGTLKIELADKNVLFKLIQKTKFPVETVVAWIHLDQSALKVALPTKVVNSMCRIIASEADHDEDVLARAHLITRSIKSMADRGCDLSTADPDSFFVAMMSVHRRDDKDSLSKITFTPASPNDDANVAGLCVEYVDSSYHSLVLGPRTPYPAPGLYFFPEVEQDLAGLGLSKEASQKIFSSWVSYDPLRDMRRARKQPSPGQIHKSAINMARGITAQRKAILKYSATYGPSETLAIVETFGIHNFAGVNFDALHRQLLSWQDGKVRTRNVVAASPHDYNRGLQGSFNQAKRNFGNDVFYFEVDSPLQLARIAVAIGKRERKNGRQPQVSNVVLSVHSRASNILLGPNGGSIKVDSLRNSERQLRKHGMSPNNYHKHLGSMFRLIIDGCYAAAENGTKPNVVAAMGNLHQARVIGTPEETHAGVMIAKNGKVMFNNRDKKVAGVLHDGTSDLAIQDEASD